MIKLKTEPIIAVNDVEKSSKWYQTILGCKSMHGGSKFDILVNAEGEVLLCLHQWGEDDHPTMINREIPAGNGLILYFRTSNLEEIRENVLKTDTQIEEDIHLNENSNKLEFAIRDPDYYYIIISEYHAYQG